MNTYIILLRGINVGGKNVLPMKELKVILVNSGFINVKTYIQSGNIVLKSAKNPKSKIEKIIKNEFGFSPEILVVSEREFNLSTSNNPYNKYEGKFVHCYFCMGAPILDVAKLERLTAASESYELIGNVFYLHAPDGIGRSKLVANIESCLGVSATGRNLNTISKLKKIIECLE